jgi:Effector Associated Constant Component 1
VQNIQRGPALELLVQTGWPSPAVAGAESELAGLHDALSRAVEGYDAEAAPASKTGLEAIILALGSAGAITAAVEAFKVWLSRDRSRHVVLSWADGDEEHRIELVGDRLSEESVRATLLAALEQRQAERDG